LDVKCGRGAFMKTQEEARRLAESLVRTGEAHGVRTQAIITPMDEPLGAAVGNALEVWEAINVLRNISGTQTLNHLSIELAAQMVLLAGLERNIDRAEKKVRAALTSGAALQKFRQIIRQQGGDPKVTTRPDLYLPSAKHRYYVEATRPGYVRA